MTKPTLTTKDVEKVAELANLPLSKNEIAIYLPQLTKTLDYVAKLNAENLATTAPATQYAGSLNFLREDIVIPSLTQTQALANAPEHYQGFVVVEFVFSAK